MEAHTDKQIIKLINVNVCPLFPNDPVTTTDIENYKKVCEHVREYGQPTVWFLRDKVEIYLGKVTKRVKYPKGATFEWFEELVKQVNEEHNYIIQSYSSPAAIMNDKRSKGIVDAIEYALSQESATLEDEGESYISVKTDNGKYSLNLFNVSFKHRKRLDDAIKLFKLKQLAKKHNVI